MLNYSNQQSAVLDRAFQALADPTRRLMVERLTLGPASVSELAQPLRMSLPAVVQHLAVLEGSGLIRSDKAGRVRTCRIEPQALQAVEGWITQRRRTWEQRLDRLGEYLAEQGHEQGHEQEHEQEQQALGAQRRDKTGSEPRSKR